MIVCLGWGSLIWDPRCLPIVDCLHWHRDGPALPVEFARKSQDGRITLVVAEDTNCIPVLWKELDVRSLEEARKVLHERECKYESDIGIWSATCSSADPGNIQHAVAEDIGAWAEAKGVEGVVWTALGPNFDNDRRTKPNCDRIISYLKDLVERNEHRNAEMYVRSAPSQIRTAYRERIERELGWTAWSPV